VAVKTQSDAMLALIFGFKQQRVVISRRNTSWTL